MHRVMMFALLAGIGGLSPAPCLAQDAPEQLTEEVTDEAPDEDVTEWSLSAGGVLSTGNTDALQVNAGTAFQLTRGVHGMEAEASYVLALSGEDFETQTTQSLRARLRYDYFFTRNDAVFVAVATRLDPFAGLVPRLQGQVGYLRNFYKSQGGKHRFWGEVGYDLTYDRFDYDRLQLDPTIDPATLPDDQVVHAARFFVGYDNRLSDDLTYKTGLEALLDVETPGDFRLGWNNALRTKIGGSLQAELRFALQLDTEPVEGAERLDTTTTLNLVYTLADEHEEDPEEE